MVSGDIQGPSGPVFNFRYRHGVDEKRRVQIPKPWRPEDLEEEFTLLLWAKAPQGACLRVLRRPLYLKLLADIEAMSSSDPLKGVRKRMIGSWSTQVKFDTTGRICIPEALANEAAILPDQEVVLVGLINLFEIWNPGRFDAVNEADNLSRADVYRDLE